MHQKKGNKYCTYVNGKKVKFDVQPTLKDNRTLVPFRKIAEALGADVSYNEKSRKVTVVKNGTTVEFKLGSKTAYINGQASMLDVPAQVENGRTLVPIRFLSTAFNSTVDFYSDSSMIVIKM